MQRLFLYLSVALDSFYIRFSFFFFNHNTGMSLFHHFLSLLNGQIQKITIKFFFFPSFTSALERFKLCAYPRVQLLFLLLGLAATVFIQCTNPWDFVVKRFWAIIIRKGEYVYIAVISPLAFAPYKSLVEGLYELLLACCCHRLQIIMTLCVR